MGAYSADDLFNLGYSENDARAYWGAYLDDNGYSRAEISQFLFDPNGPISQRYSGTPLASPRQDGESGLAKYFMNGVQNSMIGLYARDKLPDPVNMDAPNFGERMASAVGNMAADAPVYAALSAVLAAAAAPFTGGASLGLLGSMIVGGTTFATVAGLKAAKMYDLMNAADIPMDETKFDMVSAAALKEGLVGAVLPGAGRFGAALGEGAVKKMVAKGAFKNGVNVGTARGMGSVASEAATLGTMGPLMEGKMPETQDYVDNFALILGWHGLGKLAGKNNILRDKAYKRGIENQMEAYAFGGLALEDIVRAVKEDPARLVELLKSNGIPEAWKAKLELLNKASVFRDYEVNGPPRENTPLGGLSQDGLLRLLILDVKTQGKEVSANSLSQADKAVLEAAGLIEKIPNETGGVTWAISEKNVAKIREEQNARINMFLEQNPGYGLEKNTRELVAGESKWEKGQRETKEREVEAKTRALRVEREKNERILNSTESHVTEAAREQAKRRIEEIDREISDAGLEGEAAERQRLLRILQDENASEADRQYAQQELQALNNRKPESAPQPQRQPVNPTEMERKRLSDILQDENTPEPERQQAEAQLRELEAGERTESDIAVEQRIAEAERIKEDVTPRMVDEGMTPEAPRAGADRGETPVYDENGNIVGENQGRSLAADLEKSTKIGEAVYNRLEYERLGSDVRQQLVAAGVEEKEATANSIIFAASCTEMAKMAGMDVNEYIRTQAPRFVKAATGDLGGVAGETRGAFNPIKKIIALFEGRDSSTALHEMSHFWLDEVRRLAETSEQARALLNKISEIYGTKDLLLKDKDGNYAVSGDSWRALQEIFAREGEMYFRDGTLGRRVPHELRDVFESIRAWMKSVYQAWKDIWKTENGSEDYLHRKAVYDVFDEIIFGGKKETLRGGKQIDAYDVALAKYRGEPIPRPTVGKTRARKDAAGRELPIDYRSDTYAAGNKPILDEGVNGDRIQQDRVAQAEDNLAMREGRQTKPGEPLADVTNIKTDTTQGEKTSVSLGGEQGSEPQQMELYFQKKRIQTGEIIGEAAKALDVTARLGRGWKRAQYKPKAKAIDIRGEGDFEGFVNAAAPRIAEIAFDSMEKTLYKYDAELSKYSGKDTKESLGNYMEDYVLRPDKARLNAPVLTKELTDALVKNSPELVVAFDRMRDTHKLIMDMPATARIQQGIAFGDNEPGLLSRLLSRKTFHDLYRSAVNSTHNVNMLFDQWMKMSGEEIRASENPNILLRNLKGVAGLVNHFMEFGTFDFKTREVNGASYKSIIREAEGIGNLEDFSAYLTARRTIELANRPDKIDSGFSLDDAKQVMIDQAKFEGVAKKLDAFNERVLSYVRESGLLSEDALQIISELNRAYVPFHRVFIKDDGLFGVNMNSQRVGRKPIYNIEGSGLVIKDPLESVITNTFALMAAAEKNRVGQSIVKLAGKVEDGERWIEEAKNVPQNAPASKSDILRAMDIDNASKSLISALDASGTGGAEVLSFWQGARGLTPNGDIAVWQDGKMKVYHVDPEIARVYNDIDSATVGLFTRMIASGFSRWLRKGATLTPDFAVRNVFRDTITAGLVSRTGFLPGVDTFRGLLHVLKRDETYQQFLRSGGAQSCMLSLDHSTAVTCLGELKKSGFFDKAWNVIKNPLDTMAVLSEISENATRVGEFSRSMKRADFGTGVDKLIRSGYEARDLLDFGRSGADTKELNAITAFFNANVQGVDRMFRAAIENPKRFMVNAALYVALPSVMMAIRNYDDEGLREIPKSQRDLFWITGFGDGENRVYVRIPKPFEAGVLFGSTLERTVEFCMDLMNDRNGGDTERTKRDAFRGLGVSIFGSLHPNFLPTIAMPVIEHWANRSTYTGLPLVPAYLEGVVPEEQATEHNTQLSRMISKAIGQLPGVGDMLNPGPAVAENYVRGWSGGLGMYTLQLVDYAFRKAGAVPDESLPEATLADIPVIKAFVTRHPSLSAESIVKFYENYREASKKSGTKALGERESRSDLLSEYAFADIYKEVEKPRAAISTITKTIRQVRHLPSLTPEEKRKCIESLYWQAIQVAKYGNDIFERVDKVYNQLTEQPSFVDYPDFR